MIWTETVVWLSVSALAIHISGLMWLAPILFIKHFLEADQFGKILLIPIILLTVGLAVTPPYYVNLFMGFSHTSLSGIVVYVLPMLIGLFFYTRLVEED